MSKENKESKSLLDNIRNENYENTQIDKASRYDNLPDYSLRVRATIHSKAHAIKEIGLYDNINDVLDKALEKLIGSYTKETKEEIISEINKDNEQKLKRAKRSKKSNI
jgi:hypothetical protein